MSGLHKGIQNPHARARGDRRALGVYRLAAVVAAASCFLPSGSALADSVIDAAVKPYFVLGGWLAALVFVGLGFLVLRNAIGNRRRAAAAAQWPTCDGRVISADVDKRVSKSAEQEFNYFVPRIRYEYTANGIRRQGEIIRIGLDDIGYPEEQKAREHIALYPVGKTIPVRYDPQNPDDSVLEVGELGVTRKIVAGVIFASLGAAAIVFAVWSGSLPTR